MAAVLFDISPVYEDLKRGRLILTANNRQRNQILRAYHNAQSVHSNCWKEPRVQALGQWLEGLWQQLQLNGQAGTEKTLASSAQLNFLWESVIGESELASGLMRPHQLSGKAESARTSLELWLCPVSELDKWPEADPAFRLWYERFLARLEEHQLLTREDLQRRLLSAYHDRQLAQEENAWLYGFDDVPPLTAELFREALPNAQALDHSTQQPRSLCLTSAPDAEEEIRRAARWADDVLHAHPDAAIGIVVPDLGQQRARVERVFQEVFNPRAPAPEVSRTVAPFNFSAGTPLASAPVVRTALDLIALHLHPQTTDFTCQLLLDVFWGDYPQELPLRTACAIALRGKCRRELTGIQVRECVRALTDRFASAAALARTLEITRDLEREKHHRQTLPYWFERIQQTLSALGWPGSRRLDSVEYQQVQRWYETLDEMARLAHLQSGFTLVELLPLMRRTLERTPFQPQTPDSPIQVLGTLEASGLQFTHCWIMGMHHRAWPPAPEPNPLLPVGLQRQWRMPRASAERELNYAERLTETLSHCATTIIFSYPETQADQPLRPSALIQQLPRESRIGESQPAVFQDNYRLFALSGQLEPVAADFGPPLGSVKIPGGTGFFKAQAACPFSAFARYRLGARERDRAVLGFSPAERGIALHRILAEFWEKTRSLSALQTQTAAQLQQQVDALCHNAIAEIAGKRRGELTPGFCELEASRLSAQIMAWLERERERPDFTVEWIEKAERVSFAGLEFSVRIDRMDRLVDESRLIIDYKTGNAKPNAWRSTALSDPQLPLYACTLLPNELSAIAFAVINARQQALDGWGEQKLPIEGIKTPEAGDWAAQRQAWQLTLEQLANEIKAGFAGAVYRFAEAQRFDEDIRPLIRIDEQRDLQHWLASQRKPAL